MGDLTVLAVHPSSPIDPGGWRRDHAKILAEARASDADLIVGDLNATIDHEPMRRLADAGLPLGDRARQRGLAADLAGVRRHRRRRARAAAAGADRPRARRPASRGDRKHTLAIPGTDHRALVAEVAVK